MKILTVARACLILAFCVALTSPTRADDAGPPMHVAHLRNGMSLHYVELGHGPPLIFVHGSISDYDYWAGIANPFASTYRVIAYSRRYNFPNINPARPGYSAVADAEDLAEFMHALHIRRAAIVGHSYGALTALFFAAEHPDMVSSLVLAEPPAVSLLEDLPPSEKSEGDAMYRDIYARMVAPMQRDFRAGRREAGVADFIDYVFADPAGWNKLSAGDQKATMRDAHEWDVMMPQGTLFPMISPAQVRSISTPVLLISGTQTYGFLKPIMHELARLLPHRQTLWVPGTGHQMLYQKTATCDAAIAAFLQQSKTLRER